MLKVQKICRRINFNEDVNDKSDKKTNLITGQPDTFYPRFLEASFI